MSYKLNSSNNDHLMSLALCFTFVLQGICILNLAATYIYNISLLYFLVDCLGVLCR